MYKQDKEILKLFKLCEHWASHNTSHIENFEKWRIIAKQKQLIDVEDNLKNAINMIKKCNEYLLSAQKELEKIL
ncbi:MAG: hypothetical protein ACFFEO_15925 [Candidatus Thorarchaeota archaeon]